MQSSGTDDHSDGHRRDEFDPTFQGLALGPLPLRGCAASFPPRRTDLRSFHLHLFRPQKRRNTLWGASETRNRRGCAGSDGALCVLGSSMQQCAFVPRVERTLVRNCSPFERERDPRFETGRISDWHGCPWLFFVSVGSWGDESSLPQPMGDAGETRGSFFSILHVRCWIQRSARQTRRPECHVRAWNVEEAVRTGSRENSKKLILSFRRCNLGNHFWTASD